MRPTPVRFSACVRLNCSTDEPVSVTFNSVESSTPASEGPFPKADLNRLFRIVLLINSRLVMLDCKTVDK